MIAPETVQATAAAPARPEKQDETERPVRPRKLSGYITGEVIEFNGGLYFK
ncbi:MAG: hypothetical protein ACE5Q3_14220 [Alphaproteobacteria bacterium]